MFNVDEDFTWVTTERVILVQQDLAGVTLPAQWHILIDATNHELAMLISGAKSIAGTALADHANRRQLLDLLALGNQ